MNARVQIIKLIFLKEVRTAIAKVINVSRPWIVGYASRFRKVPPNLHLSNPVPSQPHGHREIGDHFSFPKKISKGLNKK